MLRVSEVYASVQGEGPNVGKTTVFVRFGGCNLRCLGWPCDTQHAIDPAYRNEWKRYNVQDLVEVIEDCMDISGAETITLTGGEPFLQKNDDLYRLIQNFPMTPIDCFSNGTIMYPDWVVNNINFIVDWKLPSSGEAYDDTNRIANLRMLTKSKLDQSVKFVIADWDDFALALNLNEILHSTLLIDNLEIFYGRVWNSEITDRELAEAVMANQLPWRLNVQLHNYIWPANERGR